MRIFLTGANGFLGSHLLRILKMEGKDDVVACAGPSSDRDGVGIEGNVIYIREDVSSLDFASRVAEETEPCDVIIHMAACLDMADTDRLLDANVCGTANIAKLASKWGVKKVVYLSSIPVIGRPICHPIDESHPISPATLYHATKLVGEAIVSACVAPADSVILRIPSPVGAGMNGHHFLARILGQCQAGEEVTLWGRGGRVQNYVDVRDICQAVCSAMRGRASGLYCIGGSSISNLELARLCIRMTGSKSDIRFQEGDPDEDLVWDVSYCKAKADFGYKPEHGLEDTIRWMMDEGR